MVLGESDKRMQTSRSRKQVEREEEEELGAYKDIVEEEKLPLLWPLPTDLPEHSLADENPTGHQQRLFRRSIQYYHWVVWLH